MKKKITIFAILLIAALVTSSCSNVNMTSLLSYENSDYSADMTVKYGNDTMEMNVVKNGDKYTFTIADEITFVFDGKWQVTYGGATVSLSEKASSRAMPTLIRDALSMSPSDDWTIGETDAGGIRLYECRSDGVTLYIDAVTHRPLRIETGKLTADITSFG